jgi:hypothetical protein
MGDEKGRKAERISKYTRSQSQKVERRRGRENTMPREGKVKREKHEE